MIRFIRVPVASSIQDLGRFGWRHLGHARAGAMDQLSLIIANRGAGTLDAAAAVEIGSGPCHIEFTSSGTACFGGARREGAPWWETLEIRAGEVFTLSPARDGVWSYLAVGGGVDGPVSFGSRSVNVREGVGSWISPGDLLGGSELHRPPLPVAPPPMSGEARIFGDLPGRWSVSMEIDRMGYRLEGEPLPAGGAMEWSEPLLVGSVQLPPSGLPIILMADGPTVGGYATVGVIHSDDVRLVAQTPPGASISFRPT